MLRSVTLIACAAVAATTVSAPAEGTPAGQRSAARGSVVTHVNGCWSTDNGAPVLDSLSLSISSGDVSSAPATLTATVHAHDVGGPGPAHRLHDSLPITVELRNASSRVYESRTVRRVAAGTWSGSWAVPRRAPWTTIEIAGVHLVADAGPDSWAQGTEQGPTSSVQVSAADPDTTPPQVTGLTVTPAVAHVRDGARRVSLVATVTDDVGVAEVRAVVGDQKVVLEPGSTPDRYTGSALVSHWGTEASLPLTLRATDVNHHERKVGPQGLADRGLPSSVGVRGVVADTERPRLSRIHLSTDRVRIGRHGGWFGVRMGIRDRISGTRSVRLHTLPYLDHPSRLLRLTSGTIHRGSWTRRVHLPVCGAYAASSQLTATAHDRAGNQHRGRRATLTLVGLDRVPPSAELSGVGPGQGDFLFTEHVHGISTAGVEVFEYASDTPLSGSWTCYSNITATFRTSCRTGRVRWADFTPTDPTVEVYSADFEPEGRLDVLDEAGNPVAADGMAFAGPD